LHRRKRKHGQDCRKRKVIGMAKRFKISDESINSYGFRVLTNGIDLTQFKQNPIMLWNHNRSYGSSEDNILPIGYWQNMTVENGALFGDPVFSADAFAQRIATMVEEGTLRACSIGIRTVEASSDPSVVLQGQRYETVTKSVLREVSITDIPSNINAVALYDDVGNCLNLSDNANCPIPILSIPYDNILTMKKVCKLLKLADTASEDVVAEHIELLQDENSQLKAQLKVLKDAEKLAKQASIKTLLDAAVTENRIAETERAAYEKLFDLDFDTTKTVLSNRATATVKLSAFTNTAASSANTPSFNGKTWSELQRDNPQGLANLKAQNFALFKAMYKADFSVEWVD
jgi:phage head maturation protease